MDSDLKNFMFQEGVKRWIAPDGPRNCTVAAGTLLSLLVLLSACASSSELSRGPGAESAQSATAPVPRVPAGDVEHRLRSEVAEWAGTPHRLGGTSTDGIDCSAFVQRVYSDVFDIGLPRTTREQVNTGEPVLGRDLQAGDLVFFRLPAGTRHVGIYMDDGEFAHASTSQGVMTSNLDEAYWKRAYWTSRRMLPAFDRQQVVASSVGIAESREVDMRPVGPDTSTGRQRASTRESSRARIGW